MARYVNVRKVNTDYITDVKIESVYCIENFALYY